MRGTLNFVLVAVLSSALVTANQVYKWNTIEFNGLTRDAATVVDGEHVYYDPQNVIMTGAHYDVTTGFVCAAFPRIKHSVPVTVGCFSADEYDRMDKPKFTAFPSVADNDLPVGFRIKQEDKILHFFFILGLARGET